MVNVSRETFRPNQPVGVGVVSMRSAGYPSPEATVAAVTEVSSAADAVVFWSLKLHFFRLKQRFRLA